MVGRSYVGNDVTHSTLLDGAYAFSYENLPKYRSYRVSNTAPRFIRTICLAYCALRQRLLLNYVLSLKILIYSANCAGAHWSPGGAAGKIEQIHYG